MKKNCIVTGGAGFLGSRVSAFLQDDYNVFVPRKADFDLRQENDVRKMFAETQSNMGRVSVVVHTAATVGGIGATSAHPADYIMENLLMGLQMIRYSHIFGVGKFVMVGSVCSYPENCPVPFHEDNLWNGYPEPTNAPYGISKKTLGSVLQAYYDQYSQLQHGMTGAYLVLANLYGPGDNFSTATSHVIPALIKKAYEAKEKEDPAITVWGTGRASRDFLYVNDAAEAICLAVEKQEEPVPINIGSGNEISISWLARKICDLVGFEGEIEYDTRKPDGQKRRRSDIYRAKELLGWQPSVMIEEGLEKTVKWYMGTRECNNGT